MCWMLKTNCLLHTQFTHICVNLTSLWCQEVRFMIETTERNGSGRGHLFQLMESIPVDIYAWPPGSQKTHSLEAAHIGLLFWIQLESTEANLHMTQISCTYSTLHTYYAGLTSTHSHHSFRSSVGRCLHSSVRVCMCVHNHKRIWPRY